MSDWTDGAGRKLAEYPHPSTAVDIAVLTYSDGELRVLVVEHSLGDLALPGTFLRERERAADAARRALRDKTRLTGIRFHQIGVFDAPDRDPRGWVISIAHAAALPRKDLPGDAHLVCVRDGKAEQPLAFDHAEMVAAAVADLRTRYAQRVDPDGLLGDEFTVLELRRLYEVIFGVPLQKDSFRRHVVDALVSTGRMSSPGAGRPAELFRRKDGARLPAQAAVLFTG
ncbi:NUDIX domain-containing protein [Rhodococcus sp. DMU1]|uniref:NUDIX hydrolase n=1 Tax=Rhodococcus sp. DMU1 TaxID=2722825 RepID=UPI00143EDDB5|nr:NUDIX domain-containing protein [Rhodococcus sp. DMU1]QIX48617.1 NUDIX hydrolase [Rhodococcus sp. DMU1]